MYDIVVCGSLWKFHAFYDFVVLANLILSVNTHFLQFPVVDLFQKKNNDFHKLECPKV